MNNYANEPHEIGWDDEVSNDSGAYIILEEGDYNFTVTSFERGRFPGSAKIKPCNMATLMLAVETDEGTANVKHDIILYTTLEWKLCAFLRAIGQKKEGEAIRPRWNEMVGAVGRAHFKPRYYTKNDGSMGTANNVERFYDYDPAFFAPNQASNPPPTPAAGQWTADAQTAPTPWERGKF